MQFIKLGVFLLVGVLVQPVFADAPDAAAQTQHEAADATVRLADSATLEYAVKARVHGLPLQTEATLIWQRDADSYQAEWNVRVPFLGERTQRSDGAVTSAGLRPYEYVEQTNKKRSARLDWDAQKIHFSDDRADQVLRSGAQDRLTVSLQLGALLAAGPERYPAGSTITLPVVGVRGAEPWYWDVKGQETLTVAERSVAVIKLVRRPRKKADSQIELWLAPDVRYLPARLRVSEENGDIVDQQLRALP